MIENNVGTIYVEETVRFNTLHNNMTPLLVEPTLGMEDFQIPAYLVPDVRNDRLWSGDIEPTSRLARIAARAGELSVSSYTLDREMLLTELEGPISTDDFILAWGLYTSMVRQPANLTEYVNNNAGIVVHKNVRDDLKTFLKKGYGILTSLPEEQQTDFLQKLVDNFSKNSKDNLMDNTWNSAIRETRLALFDIVSNPQSVVDPEVVLATSIVKKMGKSSTRNAIVELYKPFVKDPACFIKNPELLFMLDEVLHAQKTVSKTEIYQLSGGIVSELFSTILGKSRDFSPYAQNLAHAYFAVADRTFEGHSKLGTELRKPSEGNKQFMPAALIGLAAAVSKSNPGDGVKFSGTANLTELTEAFDYILPMLEIGKIWPELEEDTVEMIERALSKIISLAV